MSKAKSKSKLKYDPAQFTAPEYDARFEAETKFWRVQVQGNLIATTWGKLDVDKPMGNLKDLGSSEATAKECAKMIKEKTTAKGKDKYTFKNEQGSKKIADLPAYEGKKSTRAKKGEKAAEAEGEEEEEAEGAEGKKRARGKDDAEMKTEESSAESDAKKAKITVTDTAGTKEKVETNDVAAKEKTTFADVAAKASEEAKAMDISETEKKTEEKVAHSPPKAKAAIA